MAEGRGGGAAATTLRQINLGSRAGRGGHWSLGSRARASPRKRKGRENQMGKPKTAPEKQVGGGGAQEERNLNPAARRGCSLAWLLQCRLKIGKKEEGSGTTGVLGRGWGKPSTLTAPTY